MKKNIICFLLLFIFGCMVLGGCSNGPKEYQKVLSEEEIAQLQKEKYPLRDPSCFFTGDMVIGTLESGIDRGSFVLIEFIEQLPTIEEKYIPGKGTAEQILAEKGGMDYYTFYYPSYQFRLVNTITGEVPDYLIGEDNKIRISLAPALVEESLPNFQPGEKYVALIGEELENDITQRYSTAWFDPYFIYYVTDKECVLSATAEENFQKYSGYRLNDFEGILQEMERNPSEQVSE